MNPGTSSRLLHGEAMDAGHLAIKLHAAHKSPSDWDQDIQHLIETLQRTRQLRNAAVSINRLLPADVLRCILLETQTMMWRQKGGSNRWLFLTLVCQHWRRIAFEYQYLWRRIYVGFSTTVPCVNHILQRSGKTPLVVVIRNPVQWRSLPIWEHAHRIEEVQMSIPAGEAALDMFLDGAPLLKSFTFHSQSGLVYPDSRGLPPHAFAPLQVLPKLVRIVLGRWSDTFGALKDVLPAGLRELTVNLKEVPAYDELDATLSKLQNVEILFLNTGRAEPETRFAPGTVSMPRLSTLSVTGSTLACVFLLNVLSTPETATIHLHPDTSKHSDGWLLGSTLYDKLTSHLEEPAAWTWRVRQDDGQISLAVWLTFPTTERGMLASPERPATEITFFKSAGDAFELCCSALGRSEVTALIVHPLDTREVSRWTTFFQSLYYVEELYFSSAHLQLSVHRWLAQRVHQCSPTIPFPNLTKLIFVHTSFYTANIVTGDPDTSADAERRRCSVSWEWLKGYLAKRKEEKVGLPSLKLHGARGLEEGDVYELEGMVQTVLWNEKTIVFEQPNNLEGDQASSPAATGAGDPEESAGAVEKTAD